MDFKEYILEKKWALAAQGVCIVIAIALELLLFPAVYRLGVTLVTLFLGLVLTATGVLDELRSRTAKQELILQDLEELVKTPDYKVPAEGMVEERELAERINALGRFIHDLRAENEKDRQDLTDYIRVWTPKLEESISEFRNIANSALRSDLPNLLEHQVDQTNLVIQQLLYYLRTKTDGINSRKIPVSVNDLALQTIKRYYPMMQAKRIGYLIKGQDIVINTDPDILSFAFGQVLHNAIKYSPRKSSVGIYIKRFQEKYYLIVEDKGMGINPSDLPYIFNKNYVGKNESDENSPGMGLYLAKSFVELLGYQIGLNSKLNHGTTVAICFEGERVVPNKKQPQSEQAGSNGRESIPLEEKAKPESLEEQYIEAEQPDTAEEKPKPKTEKPRTAQKQSRPQSAVTAGTGAEEQTRERDGSELPEKQGATSRRMDELDALFGDVKAERAPDIDMEISRFVPQREKRKNLRPDKDFPVRPDDDLSAIEYETGTEDE